MFLVFSWLDITQFRSSPFVCIGFFLLRTSYPPIWNVISQPGHFRIVRYSDALHSFRLAKLTQIDHGVLTLSH